MLVKVDNVGGRLFQATGPATQNARLPSCSLVLGSTKLPRIENSRNWDAQFVEMSKLRHGLQWIMRVYVPVFRRSYLDFL